MKHLLWLFLALLILGSCGQSEEERHRLSRQERLRLHREDSAALKVAVMPTLDCLPMFVARQYHLFDTLGADVRLKGFTAQMDCDTALAGGSVECGVTDLVRMERLMKHGTRLSCVTSTGAYWQLISSRNARIKELKQLYDKMLAMTRYSATDLLGDYAVDSVKLKAERVFRVQINDVTVRMNMMLNNEMDAALLTEPQATAVRMARGKVLMDSRDKNITLGVFACRSEIMGDKNRRRQMEIFRKAYNMACDSINKYGVRHYSELIANCCKVRREVADSLPADIRYRHIAAPRPADQNRAARWLDKK